MVFDSLFSESARQGRWVYSGLLTLFRVIHQRETQGGRWGTGVVYHLLVSPSEDESAATVFAPLGSAVVSALVFVATPVNCAL